jgi:hypothetical protein
VFVLSTFFKTSVVVDVVFWGKVMDFKPDTKGKLAAVALAERTPNKPCSLSIHVESDLLVGSFHIILLKKQTALS